MAINDKKIIKGADLMLFVKVNDKEQSIGFATSHTLSISAETTEINTKDHGGRWAVPDPTSFSWSVTTENLCGNPVYGLTYTDLIDYMLTAQPLKAVFATEKTSETNKVNNPTADTGWEVGSTGYEGEVVITNVEVNAPSGENATFTVEFLGYGELVKKN